MVTYAELIAFTMMLIAFADLIFRISSKRNLPPSRPNEAVKFLT